MNISPNINRVSISTKTSIRDLNFSSVSFIRRGHWYIYKNPTKASAARLMSVLVNIGIKPTLITSPGWMSNQGEPVDHFTYQLDK